ncbi:MAG: flagellar hook-associated protein FlgK [Terriglobales bacterium]
MSLSGGLAIALSALQADQGAEAVTANNIANANTPGYSRQIAQLEEMPPETVGSVKYGSGVELTGVESVTDSLVNSQIQQQQQQNGQATAFQNAMQPVQQMFDETQGSGLGTDLSNFFSSLQQLETEPTDIPTRQAVLEAAQTLAGSFNQAAAELASQQTNADQQVLQGVAEVNSLTSQIATLNTQIGGLPANSSGAGQLNDQRTQLITQLSQLISVQSVTTNDGMVNLTTAGGGALVVGDQSDALTTQANPATGMHDVYAQGTDITAALGAGPAGGELGGYIQARDQAIPQLQSQLDTLAAGLGNAVNTQNQAGYTLSGSAGGNFFVPPPSGISGAAAALAVAITDPSDIAASSDGTAGSNGNAVALANLGNQNIVAGQPPDTYYADAVSQLGTQIQNASVNQQAGAQLLTQLQNQLGAVSGVSLDEEAANLMQYQQAYAGAAQVASVIDDMMQSAIQMIPS